MTHPRCRSQKAVASAFAALLFSAAPAAAQAGMQFPEASESAPELISLWEDSDSMCRLARREDVRVVAACVSRSIYGVALNERDWCYGREDEANAVIEWHECGEGSLRFPPLDMPDGWLP